MIIVSSFRPFDNCPKAIWEHQLAANRSWQKIFEKIFYFNHLDQRMTSAKTGFFPTEGKPSIRTMAAFCASLNDWSCIVNADIIIPLNFRRVEEKLRGAAGCAVSRRWTIAEDGELSEARLMDLGLDFFAATPTVWKAVAEEIPPAYTMGRIVWDNWMVNFFMSKFGNYCYDITQARVVFHPQHEDRQDQNWDYDKKDPVLKKNNWPFHNIQ